MTDDTKLSRRSFLSGAAALGAFAVGGLAGCAKEEEKPTADPTPAADPAPAAAPTASTKDTIYEVNVTPNPNWHFGSAGVETNPTNPDNLVYVCTATQPWDNRWHFSMGQAVYYSMDGGDSWTQAKFPFGVWPGGGMCSLQVDNSGNFFLFWNALRAPDPADDGAAYWVNPMLISKSTDGGKTWSDPVETPFVLTGHPYSAFDRGTGKFWGIGAKRGYANQGPLWIAATTDDGATWTEPRRFPYPTRVASRGNIEGFPHNWMAAHDGILVTGFQESMENKEVDDYLHFAYSTDEGATWTCSIVNAPDVHGTVGPVAATDFQVTDYGYGPYHYNNPLPFVAADPSQKGRFSLMIPRNVGATNNNDLVAFEVYTTDDCGTSWRSATIIANDGCLPWIQYGPNGELGVMWRTHHVHCYGVVSFDHGATFSQPLRFNAVIQPLGDTGCQCDHWSHCSIDGKFFHVGWSDCRTGGALSAIYGRAPLSAFQPMPEPPIPIELRVGTPLPHKEESPY